MIYRRSKNRSHGFIFIEAVAGLCLLATLTVMLSVAVGRHAVAARQNAAQLEAERLAQQVLCAAQRHEVPPPIAAGDSVQIVSLGRTKEGSEWIAATAVHAGRSARLVGPMLPGGYP